MDTNVVLVAVLVLVALTIGIVLGRVLGQSGVKLETERARVAEERALALQAQLDLLQNQYQSLQTRVDTDQQILRVLEPVKEKLEHMGNTVQDMERQRTSQHAQLTEQLRHIVTNDEHLRHTTESLASALRGTATRGRWGEVQLRRVVEAAGLIERVDFDVQSQVSGDNGTGKPDMVVHLPGGKHIAVDSKVPFSAYWDAQQISPAAAGEEGARRETLMKAHVQAVRAHVESLGKKAYWEGLDTSPDIVLCFLPSEALLSAAVEHDLDLLDWAFSKRVALVSPVGLWSVLKTVALSWQQDVLTADAKKLFDAGKELHLRLGTMAQRIESLGKSITQTVKGYNQFVATLETRVLPSARKLSAFGGPDGSIDDLLGIEEQVRELSASELITSELIIDAPKELEATPED